MHKNLKIVLRSQFLNLLFYFFCVFLPLCTEGALAQTPKGELPPKDIPFTAVPEAEIVASSNLAEEEASKAKKVLGLSRIVQGISKLKFDISESQKLLGSSESKGREDEIKAEIKKSYNDLEKLQKNFEEIASGVDISLFYPSGESSSLSFASELEDLLSPLINELKRATSRPRELDRLRTNLSDSNELLVTADSAISNLEQLQKLASDRSEIVEKIEALKELWSERKRKLKAQVSIAEQKLTQRLGEKKSLAESASEVFQLFFKSRGRNLLVALFIAILFSISVRKLQAAIQNSRAMTARNRKFNLRLFNLAFFLMSGVGGLIVFLVVLFAFGDWVLLILGFLLVFGLAWTSKEALPRFWGQAALLLNMGPVRERERVLYNGVPFRVKTLNYYSYLENPLLDGAPLRLPLNDLSDMRSREIRKGEPWFPTERGDWVLLDDRKVGQVELQTAQFVKVAILGGARRNFFTDDFVNKNFTVISKGFRIKKVFGLDYKHQSEITARIPDALKQALLDALEVRGYSQEDFKLRVEFCDAGASSLDLAIIADCPGKWAKDFEVLERLVARIAVDACNENEWVIPFQQITIHQANS